MSEQSIFYFDLGSPYAYLASERVDQTLSRPAKWKPILLEAIFKARDRSSWAEDKRRAEGMNEVESRANQRGLMPIRWPERWPSNTLKAMRAATYADQIGRGKAFAMAAFRQAFAGGRDLSDLDSIVIAAAACEISPKALLKAIESQSIKDRLRDETERAIAAGVLGVPTVQVGSNLFWGDDHLDQAAASTVE